MTSARISRRRAALAGVGAVVLAATALSTQGAGATPSPEPERLTAVQAGRLAQRIDTELRGTSPGAYYDAAARKLVVNVVDDASAAKVRAAGAEPRTVTRTAAQLASARRTLDAQARIPGTAWSVDPTAGKVVVRADSTVRGAKLDRLNKVIASLGDTVILRHTAGTLRPTIAGGDAIWAPTARCSLGFNVTKGGQPHFLTAGHCGNISKTWSDRQGGASIGTTAKSVFPGHDYALVKYTGSTSHPSAVDLYNGGQQNITQAAEATVGENVRRSGSTTQVHDGKVTGLNATVNYQEGTVTGMIATSVCAEPGDSGGALFDGTSAVGLTSGGSGDCSSGGETFFQPVTNALSDLGAQLP
ncbi:alpha-lytic protease prodomain-containing protein [Streptomyces sp. AV19]|uniref:S1 family peptidase n=1 Tax=Streptomyces sp. AV19 TaxID=2793068 RepID=UPI0018FE2B4C|nr:S1 family peptidase [Streptomyces sp. AV19]MBH1937874.1 alpha-lytic protease prodomain-containing protein [Streptomyces sp. AV19]MDG4536527.1 alpha-lytic protease prodomain-containing protein [Streptomyces sp. AV19]